MATGAQSPQQTSPCRTTWQNILGQCHPKKHRKGKSYFLLDVLQKQITGPHCFLSGAGVKYQRIIRNTFGYGWGRRAPGRISSRPQEPTLTNSLFFLTSPTFDSSWSGSSAIASAALPGPVPHAEQFLKEKAFPDICCEFAALLLLHHQFTPRSSPAPPPSPPVPSYQSSPARADDLRGELMTPHLFQSCSSPCSFSLMLTQDFALCNVTEQPDPTQANHLRVHFLSLVQVLPTRTTGLSTT